MMEDVFSLQENVSKNFNNPKKSFQDKKYNL